MLWAWLLLLTTPIWGLAVAFISLKIRIGKKLKQQKKEERDKIVVGFFHPYCNAGGGGERVLWIAIQAMHKRFSNLKMVVYTGDVDAAPDQILVRAKSRFNVDLGHMLAEGSLKFIYLQRRQIVEAELYPRFTMLFQSLGSIYLALEALTENQERLPDIFIDSMGYAFALPVFKYLAGCKVACYVHYPTISMDMLQQVKKGFRSHNNQGFIANNSSVTKAKLLYYKIFAYFYGLAGSTADLVMVNSSWTEEHIANIWSNQRDSIQRIYPPCDVSQFRQIERSKNLDGLKTILSLGQFRPEKDHPLQIRAFAKLRDMIFEQNPKNAEEIWSKIRLLLIGGVRNDEDRERVKVLKHLAGHLAVDDRVEFKLNVSFDELKREMSEAEMGLHTMWNEHFGIAIVEMMAAGLVTLAHRSGGPLMDIVQEGNTGFLAINEEEYAENMLTVLEEMSEEAKEELRMRAKSSVSRFSDAEFEAGWIRAIEAVINQVHML